MSVVLRFERFEVRPDLRQVWVGGVVSPLGARAFDLLMMLIEHRERVVLKEEMFSRIWPGLVVEDNNLSVQISSLRKVLGTDAITTSQGRGYQFTAKLDSQSAALRPDEAGNLPALQGPIFGREDEQNDLVRAFDVTSCVTVCGLAGIGKTTLAKAAAHQLSAQLKLPHGAWYVELADVQDCDSVVPAICEVLGIDLTPRSLPLQQCIDHLRHLQLLLVLDNCEHVIEPVSALVAKVLSSAIGVKVMATSHEPLRVANERVLRLPPLETPASVDGPSAKECGSMQMLHQRVKAALGSEFEPSDDEFEDMVEICRQLDGVPLALEFASARVPLLGLAGVRSRLHDRLRLLAGGQRAAPTRHRSLQAALEWSHQLLSPRTREVLHRLATFPGGFSLAGAELLLDTTEDMELLGHLDVLVERSLVTVTLGPTPRYRMLETTRAFALECLGVEDDLAEWQARHARAMSKLCVVAAGQRDTAWMWQEMPNARSALTWAIAAPDASETAVTIATYISVVLGAGGAIGEALEHLLRVQPLLRDDLSPALVARYWHWLGRLGVEGRLPSSQCVEALQRADAMFQNLGEPRHRHACQRHLAEAELRSGRLGAAEDHLAAARALEHTATPAADRMRRMRVEALVADAQGNHQAALRHCQTALTLAEASSVDRYRLLIMSDMAWTHLRMGRSDTAVTAFQDLILHLDDTIRQGLARAHAACGLTVALIAAGRINDASRAASRAVRTLQQANLLRARSEVFAWLAATLGDMPVAAILLGVGDSFLRCSETERDPISALARTRALELIEAAMTADDRQHWGHQGATVGEAELVHMLDSTFTRPEE